MVDNLRQYAESGKTHQLLEEQGCFMVFERGEGAEIWLNGCDVYNLKEPTKSNDNPSNIWSVGPYGKLVGFERQQIRAIKLVEAFWEKHQVDFLAGKPVAVVGCGVAGVTTIAALWYKFLKCEVQASDGDAMGRRQFRPEIIIIEKFKDPLSYQKHAAHRYIHPNYNIWPNSDHNFSHMSNLPFMNWVADYAPEVLDQLREQYDDLLTQIKTNFKVTELMGAEFQSVDKNVDDDEQYPKKLEVLYTQNGRNKETKADFLFLTTGFGEKKINLSSYEAAQKFDTTYWRLGQNAAGEVPGHRVISGDGDGAMVEAIYQVFQMYKKRMWPSMMRTIAKIRGEFANNLNPGYSYHEEKIIKNFKNCFDGKILTEEEVERGNLTEDDVTNRILTEEEVRDRLLALVPADDENSHASFFEDITLNKFILDIIYVTGGLDNQHPYSKDAAIINNIYLAYFIDIGVIKYQPEMLHVKYEDDLHTANFAVPDDESQPTDATDAPVDNYQFILRHGADPFVNTVNPEWLDEINRRNGIIDNAIKDSFLTRFDPVNGEVQRLSSVFISSLFNLDNDAKLEQYVKYEGETVNIDAGMAEIAEKCRIHGGIPKHILGKELKINSPSRSDAFR